MPLSAEKLALYQQIGRGQGQVFDRYIDWIWGDDTRMGILEAMLDAKSVAENIILTRGVCEEVQIALDKTSRNGRPAWSSKFSRVIDTAGDNSKFIEGKWVTQPKLDVKRFCMQKGGSEISKDLFLVRDVLNGIPAEQKDHKVAYIDDDAQTTYIEGRASILQTPEQKARVLVFKLEKEADGGVTSATPGNQAVLAALQATLAEAPAGSLHLIWDFDSTLTAQHLYKSWQCAKKPNTTIPGWGLLWVRRVASPCTPNISPHIPFDHYPGPVCVCHPLMGLPNGTV